jgi:hypothetical protein
VIENRPSYEHQWLRFCRDRLKIPTFLAYRNALPALVKQYVYQRMIEVLNGTDHTQDFNHLSAGDRKAILEILTDTKPDFAQELSIH